MIRIGVAAKSSTIAASRACDAAADLSGRFARAWSATLSGIVKRVGRYRVPRIRHNSERRANSLRSSAIDGLSQTASASAAVNGLRSAVSRVKRSNRSSSIASKASANARVTGSGTAVSS
ncbi:Uncharacterised protein [Mycobacteroides abscessus subsp. abscessus]|nr:Uncharacterised protein [Mycobacteroides abscessus subsp. abscessus]